MIAGMYQARKSNLGDLMKFLTGRLKMETREERIWLLIGTVSIALFLFWAGALVYAYLGDDRGPAPADERSVPAPRAY
jgi:H+/Cl- antiporter ClcA